MCDEFDLLFLTGLFPKEMYSEIINNSKGNVQNAANNLQWLFLNGFDDNNRNQTKILNSLFIGSFPKRYRVPSVKSFKFNHNDESTLEDINVGFVNLPVIKHFSKYYSILPHLKRWALKIDEKEKVLIAYAMTSNNIRLLKYAKFINPRIKTCLIIPDLPQFMNISNKSVLYRLFKKADMKIIAKNMQYADTYVLLTEKMAELLSIDSSYTVVEGISSISDTDSIPNISQNEIKSILYTGGLNEEYGINNLIESFTRLKNTNYRLILCGAGPLKERIEEAAKNDPRIIYKGLLSKAEVVKLQYEATILVNPRQNIGDFTKYSFPSKILEYMSSGRPVLAYKLDGIPEEYYRFMFLFDEYDNMDNAIEAVLSKGDKELSQVGFSAYEFVKKNKNAKVQCKRVIELIKSC